MVANTGRIRLRGIRARHPINERWARRRMPTSAGFNVGSDRTCQASAGFPMRSRRPRLPPIWLSTTEDRFMTTVDFLTTTCAMMASGGVSFPLLGQSDGAAHGARTAAACRSPVARRPIAGSGGKNTCQASVRRSSLQTRCRRCDHQFVQHSPVSHVAPSAIFPVNVGCLLRWRRVSNKGWSPRRSIVLARKPDLPRVALWCHWS